MLVSTSCSVFWDIRSHAMPQSKSRFHPGTLLLPRWM
jgi:hypothetical protein